MRSWLDQFGGDRNRGTGLRRKGSSPRASTLPVWPYDRQALSLGICMRIGAKRPTGSEIPWKHIARKNYVVLQPSIVQLWDTCMAHMVAIYQHFCDRYCVESATASAIAEMEQDPRG